MVTDPVGDFITRFKNAGRAGHATLAVPYSELKYEVARILEREGYVSSVSEKGSGPAKKLIVGVAYRDNASPRLSDAHRVSKPSRRFYKKARDIRPYKYGKGLAVISTPQGLLTDKEAREQNVGGEMLFTIW